MPGSFILLLCVCFILILKILSLYIKLYANSFFLISNLKRWALLFSHGVLDEKFDANLAFVSFLFLLLCWVGVHCDTYKSFYDISKG
jgi:hypothetical protein